MNADVMTTTSSQWNCVGDKLVAQKHRHRRGDGHALTER